jgi:hypothetical protein
VPFLRSVVPFLRRQAMRMRWVTAGVVVSGLFSLSVAFVSCKLDPHGNLDRASLSVSVTSARVVYATTERMVYEVRGSYQYVGGNVAMPPGKTFRAEGEWYKATKRAVERIYTPPGYGPGEELRVTTQTKCASDPWLNAGVKGQLLAPPKPPDAIPETCNPPDFPISAVYMGVNVRASLVMQANAFPVQTIITPGTATIVAPQPGLSVNKGTVVHFIVKFDNISLGIIPEFEWKSATAGPRIRFTPVNLALLNKTTHADATPQSRPSLPGQGAAGAVTEWDWTAQPPGIYQFRVMVNFPGAKPTPWQEFKVIETQYFKTVSAPVVLTPTAGQTFKKGANVQFSIKHDLPWGIIPELESRALTAGPNEPFKSVAITYINKSTTGGVTQWGWTAKPPGQYRFHVMSNFPNAPFSPWLEFKVTK